jgi:hypothetical protein
VHQGALLEGADIAAAGGKGEPGAVRDSGAEAGRSLEQDKFVAFVHNEGVPQWGEMRLSAEAAANDRKGLLAARKAARLQAAT